MKPIRYSAYLLCLAAVLVTVSPAQTNLGGNQNNQIRSELQRVQEAFAAWAKSYASKTSGEPTVQALNEGLVLAKERRVVLRQLIESNPALALSPSIGKTVRNRLPLQIQNEMETEVSGTGDLLVLCAVPALGAREGGGIQRLVRLNGKTYRAVGYERRMSQTTKYNVPLHGIALDGVLALDELLLPDVATDEASGSAESKRPLIASASGGTTYQVLVIRVDFPDLPGDPRPLSGGDPYTASSVQALADGQIATYYQRSSYGKVAMNFTVTPQLYRLPGTAAYYASTGKYFEIYSYAIGFAQADYPGKYDKVIVLFSWLGGLPDSQLQFGGLSLIGDTMAWVNGEFDFRVLAHELGHTLGLYHANFWQTPDGNSISPNGLSLEGADPFDTMGWNWRNDGRVDFDPWFKRRLNWISDDQVQIVTQNGSYRVYRFDDAQATGTLALKVAKDDTRDYWIGYRRNFFADPGSKQGAYVVWGYHQPWRSNLLGLGPVVNRPEDPVLELNTILADSQGDFTITPVAEGGDAPHEYQDVQITFGPPPTITRQPDSQTALGGETTQFTIEATGDAQYAWQRQASGLRGWVTLSDGQSYLGTRTPILQIPTASTTMNGDAYRCVLTNSAGGFNSSRPAVLTVREFGVATLAGQSGEGGSADGHGVFAQFNNPMGIAVDRAGNAYVADSGNYVIRKVSATGVVSTLAGLAGAFGSNDGVGEEARFDLPVGITVDSAGVIYVVDQFDSTVRSITPDAVVTTLETRSMDAASADQIMPSPRLNHPSGIAVDCSGNLYIADTGNNTIRKLAPDGSMTTFAGESGIPGLAEGQGAAARFNSPLGIAVDLDGNVYVADQGNLKIRKITADGSVTTIADVAGDPGSPNGSGALTQVSFPAGLAVDDAGNLYFADRNNSIIREIDTYGNVSTVAGVAGAYGSADGTCADALFDFPVGLAVAPTGVVYVADTSANTIRLVRGSVPQPPMLRLKIVSGQVMVCWPASATGWVLQSRSDLSPNRNWAPVPTAPVVQGCNFVVTTTLQTPAAFFRLQHQ